MIDYDGLKIVHELAEKYSRQTNSNCEVSFCCQELNRESFFRFKWSEPNHELDWPFELDELINKLTELTSIKSEQKYKIGQQVWRIDGEDLPRSMIIMDIDNNSDAIYLSEYFWWLEEYLYPSKEELIFSKIKHWSDMLEPKEEYCDVSGMKLGKNHG